MKQTTEAIDKKSTEVYTKIRSLQKSTQESKFYTIYESLQ